MQEFGFNIYYLEDMKLWVMYSQFIVEYINVMIILVWEYMMLILDFVQCYFEFCEIVLQCCQQWLDSDGFGSVGDVNIMELLESEVLIGLLSILEQYL